MTSTIGIPIKLLNEATGHVVTLEITSGQVYRGKLLEAEDNMNVQLKDITVTARDGRVSHLDQVYIRGSHVRFFIVPDMLRNAPMFRQKDRKGRGVGLARGRATAVELTGSAPEPVDGSTAGLTHAWTLETAYYTADLPIWIDEISDAARWKEEFLKPEAREVVTALGAWIYCFRRPVTSSDLGTVKSTLRAIQEVIERHVGYAWDGVCLAVAMQQSTTPYLEKSFDDWDDLCRDFGFEYVDSEAKDRNEYSEPVGIERLREALEANEWDVSEGLDIDIDDFGDFDQEAENELEFSDTFAAEEAEMGREFAGLKMAVATEEGGEGESAGSRMLMGESKDEVEEFERMMGKMMAIKDLGSAMPEGERKKYAAKAVNDLMKEMDIS
ncbi:hypothetical protein LTS18_012497 [Coniosporium uncinatum]|uniref:Uncharacterized protein n=1 Tax=Coniosporium uncinatum TaxID=93489 RepID=A0ACC3DCB4_9PEZI|nr:hypothetical protein LTS18_012497 [Coniosporium uncinatum]